MISEPADHAVEAVLAHEDGYSDDVRDPGGATNRGITLAVLADYRVGRVILGMSP